MTKVKRKFYSLKIDRVFKSVLLDEKSNYDFLNNLLEDILKEEIKIIDLKVSELPIFNVKGKVQVLDILASTIRSGLINIEVNINFDDAIKERNLGYYTTAFSQRFLRGGKISEKVLQINLNFEDESEYELEEIVLYNKTKKEIYYEDFKIINVNLAKYKEKWYDEVIKGNEEKIYFVTLAANEEELEKIRDNCHEVIVKETIERVFELNEDGTITRLVSYEDEQKWLIKRGKELAKQAGIKEGKEVGIKEGIKENQINTARELLKRDMSIHDIIEITKLSEEEIIKIQKEL